VGPRVLNDPPDGLGPRSPRFGEPLELHPFLRGELAGTAGKKNSELGVEQGRAQRVNHRVLAYVPDVVGPLGKMCLLAGPAFGTPKVAGNADRLKAVLKAPGKELRVPDQSQSQIIVDSQTLLVVNSSKEATPGGRAAVTGV
jgi:hypothetical protein